MQFLSRQDAGRKLAKHLIAQRVQADIVLGLPRGGVVVAAEIAAALSVPLDVLVVRKIGHPRQREFAVGALAEGDVVILDTEAMERTHVRQNDLAGIIAEEKERLREYRQKFESNTSVDVAGKSVLLVDDGIATGLTTEAAVASAQKRGARRVMVAAPVTSDSAFERLRAAAHELWVLLVDPDFEAVGQYYRHFEQTTDEEVLALLNPGRQKPMA